MDQALASLFAIPHVALGPPPVVGSKQQEGEVELAELRYFEHNHPGIRLNRSAAAAKVEMDAYLREMGMPALP
jgi:hypothetical protein